MQTINWQQFGLRSNPYDTEALTEGGELSIRDAFVGRESERKTIDALLESENRLALAVCGGTGVGKTSLVNYEKYLWKNNTKKQLFSFRREIEACDDLLDKRNFLLEIIASVIREMRLIEPNLLKNGIVARLSQLVDITQTMAISASVSADVLGYGGGFGFSKDISVAQPMKMPTATLEQYFLELLEFIKSNTIGGIRYSGLIVHANNFDELMRRGEASKERMRNFFGDIRDILQTKDAYFIFLGPRNFQSEIITPIQRVKSVFSFEPLLIEPLAKREVVRAFEERMKLLKSEGVSEYIRPVHNDVVFRLHDLYHGDIRCIMTALRDLLGQYSEKLASPLTADEAMLLLGKERWERVEQMGFGTEQQEVLKFIVTRNGNTTQKDITDILKKAASNVSSYYIGPFKENQIIEEKGKEGRTILYGLTTTYEPLRWFFESRKQVEQQNMELKSKQESLFSPTIE